MKNRFYSVRVGRNIGIFTTWAECEAQTKGFKNAQFKSFSTEADAINYLNAEPKQSKKSENIEKNNDISPTAIGKTCTAYIDGSYNAPIKRYGWGIVFITDEISEPDVSFGGGTIKELTEMRNVAGEIIASSKAIEKAIELGFDEIHVYHDYTGIAKWATREWRANKEYTKRYADFCQKSMTQINIIFHWVKGHSNDEYNDMADMLAKKGAHVA